MTSKNPPPDPNPFTDGTVYPLDPGSELPNWPLLNATRDHVAGLPVRPYPYEDVPPAPDGT
jgi:hypothetical protein